MKTLDTRIPHDFMHWHPSRKRRVSRAAKVAALVLLFVACIAFTGGPT